MIKILEGKMSFSRKASLLFFMIFSLLCGIYFDGSRKINLEIAYSETTQLSLQIPKRDKRRLEYFFRKLILVDSAGYTILGSKPLSLGVYLTPFSTLFFQSLTPKNLRMYFAWKTWKKYESYFQNTNLKIWSEPNPWVDGAVLILVANVKNFHQVINQHTQLFQKILEKKNISAEELLDKGSKGVFLVKGLQAHEGLLGIVLGYGEKNSWLFYEGSQEKEIDLSPIWGPKESQANLSRGKLALKMSNPKSYSNLLTLPMFTADKNSLESEMLRKKYQQERAEILLHYEGKDFLKTSLAFFL